MLEGDWNAIKEQVMAEITDKAPLIAHAYNELSDAFVGTGSKPSPFEMSLLCQVWVNVIIENVEIRMREMQEELDD